MRIHEGPDHARVAELLAECGLPTSDLAPGSIEAFLGCGDPSRPGGVVGLEVHGRYGLLRSLAVAEGARGAGCGKALVSGLEARARQRGLESLYLLTETAEPFFAALGYRRVQRGDVPQPIRATSEFASICPDSAAVMRKDLGA